MNAALALARLRELRKPVVTTDDAALAIGSKRSAATRTLGRLAAVGLLLKVRHGLWALEPHLDPLVLPGYLTAPLPSYVSFQTALFLHGMVAQVPSVTYVASLARTRRVSTRLGTFSIHRLAPRFFGGCEAMGSSGVLMATPEKALLDMLYLAPTRSRLFAHLPEIELPRAFDRREARRWVARITAGPRRTMVARRLDRILAAQRPATSARARPVARRLVLERGARRA